MVRYLDSGLLPLVPVNTNTNKKACFNPVMNIHEPCSGAPFPTTVYYLLCVLLQLMRSVKSMPEAIPFLHISTSKYHCQI